MPASTPLHSPTRRLRPIRFVFITATALVASACSSMQDIPAGASLAEVQARYGAPTVECPLADGSRSAVWSTQPMGQYAWGTTIAPDGTVGPIEQILTDTGFRKVEIGVWDTERLRCAFGLPAEIKQIGLPSVRQTVWSYRYKEAGTWNSLMHVYVSDDGIVQRMHPGPDPLFEQEIWPFL